MRPEIAAPRPSGCIGGAGHIKSQPHGPQKELRRSSGSKPYRQDAVKRGMKQSEPATLSFIEPMMALRVRELPVGNRLYEMKFDLTGTAF